MIKIRIFADHCNSEICKSVFIRIYELEKEPLFGTKFTIVTTDDFTHAILLNKPMPQLNIPKENVIGLAHEPIHFLRLTNNFIDYAIKNIGTYYIGDKPNVLPDVFAEYYGYGWNITPIEEIPNKNKLISLMISNKTSAPGHKYRHILCQEILKSDLPIDIYGRGVPMYHNIKDTRLKGIFKELEPYYDYKFHIAIENFTTNHYFSEKIKNPLLCSTTPIYLGCKNIDSYFSNNVIKLSGDIVKDMELLKNICSNPEKYRKNINVNDVKKEISIVNLLKKQNWI